MAISIHMQEINCPYCNAQIRFERDSTQHHGDCTCSSCSKRFIYDVYDSGAKGTRLENASCCDDPACRETELSAADY